MTVYVDLVHWLVDMSDRRLRKCRLLAGEAIRKVNRTIDGWTYATPGLRKVVHDCNRGILE